MPRQDMYTLSKKPVKSREIGTRTPRGMPFCTPNFLKIPDLKLPEENRSIGKYGRMHRNYLQEHNPIRFNDLVLEGKLWNYFADLNEQAQDRLQLIIRQMQEAESVNDELKELFSRYIDCVQEFQIISECLLFQNSFRLGARIMQEVMEE